MAKKRKKTRPIDSSYEQLRNRFEPLREELHQYLQDGGPYPYFISHPFCIQPISNVDRCALIHEQIDRRAAEADACFESQDWEGYLARVEYQYQPEWFAKDADLLSDDRYWSVLRQVYGAQKTTILDRDLFDELFRSDRPGREFLMNEEEQAILARLPKRLRVYRGYSGEDLYADGIAWTLDRRQAVWYANCHREDDNPMVASGTVAKAGIWAYLSGGDILLPSEVVKNRRDVDAFDDAARGHWDDFVTPDFDVSQMLVRQR